MCYYLEYLYKCGHQRRESNVTCKRPRLCRMGGDAGVLQEPVDDTCGDEECAVADNEDPGDGKDDDKDGDDERSNDKKNQNGGNRYEEDDDKSFGKNSGGKNQRNSWITTRRVWNEQNPPPPPQQPPPPPPSQSVEICATKLRGTKPSKAKTTKRQNEGRSPELNFTKRAWTKYDSDSSLSPLGPSDDENPFGEDFSPKKYPTVKTAVTSEGRRKGRPHSAPQMCVVARQFQGLNIFELEGHPVSPVPGITSHGGGLAAQISTPLRLHTGASISPHGHISPESPSSGPAEGNPVVVGGFQEANAYRRLKSAIKQTDYIYVRPGRLTRSQSAAQSKLETHIAKQHTASKASVATKKSENHTDRQFTPDKTRPAKRVRFAEGSKETSGHVVLVVPSRLGSPTDNFKKKNWPNRKFEI